MRALSSAHAGDAQYEPGMEESLSLPTCRAPHVVCMLALHKCACTHACTAGGSSHNAISLPYIQLSTAHHVDKGGDGEVGHQKSFSDPEVETLLQWKEEEE